MRSCTASRLFLASALNAGFLPSEGEVLGFRKNRKLRIARSLACAMDLSGLDRGMAGTMRVLNGRVISAEFQEQGVFFGP